MRSDPTRNAIDPTLAERVAAQDAPAGEDRAAHCAVRHDGVFRVVAAARIEAALPAEGTGEDQPISVDRAHGEPSSRRPGPPSQPSHLHAPAVPVTSAVISSTNSRLEAPSIAARATRTASRSPASGPTSAHAARKIRRARLRCTAPPIRLLAIAATRPDPGARNTTTRRPRIARSPSRMLEISRERTASVRSGRSNGESRAALAAPRREDRTTGARAHAVAEPVHLRAAAVVRLERPFALGHGS